MKKLVIVGGKNAEYYNILSNEIDEVFKKITINLGLMKRQEVIAVMNQSGDAFLQVSEQYTPFLHLS